MGCGASHPATTDSVAERRPEPAPTGPAEEQGNVYADDDFEADDEDAPPARSQPPTSPTPPPPPPQEPLPPLPSEQQPLAPPADTPAPSGPKAGRRAAQQPPRPPPPVEEPSAEEAPIARETCFAWDLIDPSELALGEELGRGAMGTVHSSQYRGELVAVKTLRDASSAQVACGRASRSPSPRTLTLTLEP